MRHSGVLLVLTLLCTLLVGCAATRSMVRHGHDHTFSSVGRAFGAAQSAFSQYLTVFDQVSAAGGLGVDRLRPLVTDEQFVLEQAHADLLRLGGFTAVGSSSYDGAQLLEHFDYGPGVASITMRVCIDTSQVRTIDARGYDLTAGAARRAHDVTFVTSDVPPFPLLLEGAEPSDPAAC